MDQTGRVRRVVIREISGCKQVVTDHSFTWDYGRINMQLSKQYIWKTVNLLELYCLYVYYHHYYFSFH